MGLNDGSLTARISVDVTELRAGMRQGVDVVSDGSEEMAQAMSLAKLEAGQLQEAYRKLGPIAAQGNADAVRAVAEHIRANDAALASVLRLEAAQRSQAEAAQAAAAQAAAASVVRDAAAGAGGQDELEVAKAAAVQDLVAAKMRLTEVTQAAAVANLDEQTTLQALASVQAEVTAAQQEAAAAQAALTERSEARTAALAEETAAAEAAAVSARATAETEELAANSGADAAAVRLAQAYLQKAAAQVEVKRVTDLANASSADAETKAAAIAPALAREREAIVELTAAQKAFAASAEQAAVASEMEAGAAAHSVTSTTAASGAIRVFEGALPIRAVEAFITKVLPLGGILQAAFPVIGAIALFEMIVHIQEAIEKVGEKSELAAEKLQRDFRDATAELRNTALQLDATNERLQESIDKLEKKPSDGLRAGLAEARVEAARLGDELDKDLDKIEQLSKKHTVGFWAGMTEGKGQTGAVTDALLKAKRQVDEVRHSYDETLDTARAAGESPENIENIQQHRLAAIQKAYDSATKPLNEALAAAGNAEQDRQDPRRSAFGSTETYQGGGMEFSSGKDNTEAVGLLRSGLQTFESEQEIIGSEYRKGHLETTKTILEGSKAIRTAQKDEAATKLKGFEDERQEQIDAGKIGAQADLDFWTRRISAFKKGTDQYKAVQSKIDSDKRELGHGNEQYLNLQDRGAEIQAKNTETQALVGVEAEVAAGKISKVEAAQRSAAATAAYYADVLKILHDEQVRVNSATDITPEEKRNRGASLVNQQKQTEGERDTAAENGRVRVLEAQREAADRSAEAQRRMDAAVTQGKEIADQNREQMQLASIAAAEHDGHITAVGAAEAAAAVHTAFYKEKLEELRGELERLQAQAETLKPDSTAANANAEAQQRIRNQMAQLGGQANASSMGDLNRLTNEIAKPYLAAFGQVESGFMSMQQQILTGHKTFAQAMRAQEQQWALGAIEAAERVAFRHIEADILTTARHAAEKQMQVSTDKAASTESTVITGRENIKQITSDAAAAAAKAYKALAGVPVVGPELGAAAAAATFIAVEGFGAMASFDKGTSYIPRDGIAMLHEGEAVVPAPTTAVMHQVFNAVQRNGDQTNSISSKSGPTYHNTFTNHFHGDKAANPRRVAGSLEQQVNRRYRASN